MWRTKNNLICTGEDIKATPFHNEKGSSQQEEKSILTVYAQENRPKLTMLKRETDKPTNVLKRFNTPLSQ